MAGDNIARLNTASAYPDKLHKYIFVQPQTEEGIRAFTQETLAMFSALRELLAEAQEGKFGAMSRDFTTSKNNGMGELM